MKLFILLSFLLFAASSSWGQQVETKGGEKIIYKYKKFQKFDFEDLVIEGETGNPGDLSIRPRYETKFKNPLPYRKNFNAEMKTGIEVVR